MVDIIQLTEGQNEIKDRERNSSPLFLFPGFRARTLVLSCFWNINCTNGPLGSQAFGLYYYSRGTEPLTCGFRCYFHIESVSIELTCRIWTPAGVQRTTCWSEENPQNILKLGFLYCEPIWVNQFVFLVEADGYASETIPDIPAILISFFFFYSHINSSHH